MFDRTERAFFAGNDVAGIVNRLQRVLQTDDLFVQQTSPVVWAGKSPRTSWWIAPRVTLMVSPTPRGFVVEARVSADIEPGGAIAMVLSWFFCFPGAIIMAVLAYQDFTNRQRALFERMNGEVAHLMIEPNFPGPFAAFQGPPRW